MGGSRGRWVVWGFVLLIVAVGAVVGAGFLLPDNIGLPETFAVSPGEITLCLGQGWQFRAVSAGRLARGVKWEATGGMVGLEGFYVAPGTPGDYQVSAQHPRTGYRASAAVHAAQCIAGTPVAVSAQLPESSTATPLPPTPTLTPSPPTPTSLPPAPAQTPTLLPTPTAFLDASNDFVSYDTLLPITGTYPGSDIRTASFDEQRRLVRALPEELASAVSDWDTQRNLILWMTLHEPLSETSNVERYWLFALDTDDNIATGRPMGDGVVNPDLGVEVTIGIHTNPALGIRFEPYLMVWNAQTSNTDYKTADMEARLSATRDTVFIRISLAALADLIRTLSWTEPDWDRAVGRAAAMLMTDQGKAVDFYPERP